MDVIFSSGEVVDYRGNIIKPYPDSLKILSFLSSNNIGCSIASRTGEVAGAELLIKLFGWSKFLQHKQIYPGSKIPHITKLVLNVLVKKVFDTIF